MEFDLEQVATSYGSNVSDLAQMLGKQPGGKWAKIIYWRRPQENFLGEPDEHAGWIVTHDADTQKRLGRMELGYVPLVNLPNIKDGKLKWVDILSHPRGPEQFPLTQIIELRWYDVRELRKIWPDAPKKYLEPRVGPARLFPQLRGVSIERFPCPNCRVRTFHEPEHLSTHLHNTHGFSYEAIYAYGESVGINLNRRMKDRASETLTFEDVPDDVDEGEAVAPVLVSTRRPGRPLKLPEPVEDETE